MDSARPGNPPIILSQEDAALRLAVTVDVLTELTSQGIIHPTLTESGELGYPESQINHVLEHKTAILLSSSHLKNQSLSEEAEPGRADAASEEVNTPPVRSSQGMSERFLHWVGNGFY